MAEAAELALLQRRNRRPRRPQTRAPHAEDAASRNLIKRRPPRRPRLPDGSFLPAISTPVQHETQNAPSEFKQNELYYEVRQKIEETNERFSMLHLSRESLVDVPPIVKLNQNHHSDIESSTPEKSVSEDGQKKKRTRRKTKKKYDSVNCENVMWNHTVVPEPSTSTIKENIKSDAKKKTCRWLKRRKPQKLSTDASEESDLLTNSDKAEVANQQKTKDKEKKERRSFNEHFPVEVVRKLLAVQDPEKPNIVEGCIRINPRCYKNAYISLTNGESDILIVGLKDRNRALEGDTVAVVINQPDKWFTTDENTIRKTGSVVSILEKAHPRKAVGFLKKQDVFVVLQPRDSRIPIIKINSRSVPKRFYDNPELFEETLFLCNIVDWKKVAFAEGEIQKVVGTKGDLTVESHAILVENDLTLTPYENELLEGLPPADYNLSESDLIDREDFRKTCIFSIDPATAVDLDDALSCKQLENGNFEIGVHISDVTHFLEAFSPLDLRVAERATTVYMVDNVYHMLPKQLCMACSLLPGRDKLAFSVILELTPEGKIVDYRFCKSVINSCCQMAYEQAQIMIDDENYDWDKDGSLKIYNGYTPSDLTAIVRNLYRISRKLKERRFDQGALKIDQAKLCVFLDETGKPMSYKLEEKRESNSLIEEFMLLANMTVAKHLYENMPEVSLLRSHAEPSKRLLTKTRDLLRKFGVILDIDTAGALNNSLSMQQVEAEGSLDVDVAHYRWLVINNLCAKSMTRAVYKCSSQVNSKEDLKHYALNAEFYTHFTSPIRRYPDCVVHRLLLASIKNQPLPEEWSSELCKKIAANCNTKKYSAKMAQEQSNTLYFTFLLDLKGPINVLAIVMDVKERSVDAMLCETGLKVRLYFDDTFEDTVPEYSVVEDVPTVRLTWTERGIVQVISLFSILNVKLTKHAKMFRLQGIILPPGQMN